MIAVLLGEHTVRGKINLGLPSVFDQESRGTDSSFIGLEKCLDAFFLVQSLEVVVPCQYRISQQTIADRLVSHAPPTCF